MRSQREVTAKGNGIDGLSCSERRMSKTSETGRIEWTPRELLNRFNLESVRIKTGVLDATIEFSDVDAHAARDLYVELLTRIATQPLDSEHGDEKTACEGVYSLYSTTRSILRLHGRKTLYCSKVAIPVLNQIDRPFTAK